MLTERKLLTIRETAQRYGIPECAVRRWAKAGELVTIKSGSRAYIVPASIEHLLDTQTAASEEIHIERL